LQAFNLFEVCLALREFRKHRLQLLPLERKSILFNSFHDWFAQPFAAWLTVVAQQVPFSFHLSNIDLLINIIELF
jgi:hypothetical protein